MLSEPLLLKQVIPNANLLFLKQRRLLASLRALGDQSLFGEKNLIEVVFPQSNDR